MSNESPKSITYRLWNRPWNKLWNLLGFQGKTLWDWLRLLVVPLALATVVILFQVNATNSQRDSSERLAASDLEIEAERAREVALQSYIDRLTELLLANDLRLSKDGDDVQAVSRARTLTTLRQLDGSRKGQLLLFLYEAGLVNSEPVVKLHGADFRCMLFERGNLLGANLSGADFTGANLRRANLSKAVLTSAIFKDADLFAANLDGADLRFADLDSATFYEANLRNVNLDLGGFPGLFRKYGHPSGFQYPEELAEASSLVGVLYDGSIMTQESYQEFLDIYDPGRVLDAGFPKESRDGNRVIVGIIPFEVGSPRDLIRSNPKVSVFC